MNGITKIAVFDYDDTLRPSYKAAAKEVVEIWNTLRYSETLLVISTGRSYRKIKAELLKNNFDFPDYIISDQGTIITDCRTNTIIKKVTVPNKPVIEITQEFLRRNGRPEMIRVSNGEKLFAVDCPDATEFFCKNNEPDLILMDVENMYDFIYNGIYCKVLLMDSEEKVNSLLPFCEKYDNEILASSTGATNYGTSSNIKNFRLELVNSHAGKYNSLMYLIEFMQDSGEIPRGNFLELLAVGDEMSDLGLAECAIQKNSNPNMRGFFACIGNNTHGSKDLLRESMKIAGSINQTDKVLNVASVQENGAIDAINIWMEKLNHLTNK